MKKGPQVPSVTNTNHLQPKISSSVYNQVSDFRKARMQREYERGLISDGSSHQESNGSSASFVTSSVSPGVINKEAQQSPLTGGSGADWRGGHGSGLKQLPEVYSPLWLNSNLNLPRDRATMNAWCRSFFALQPFVQNAINLHSTYPISKLNIKCQNKKIENFFGDMNEEIELENVSSQIAQEYWLLGEAFPYAELDQNNAKWSKIILQNPDYIVVKRSAVASEPLIMMRPDENLKKIIFSNKPSDVQQRQQLNPTIIEHIRRGENIPLDNFCVTHLARKLSAYEVRGTSLLVSCFRQLMLFDMLRENKFVQASELINPLTLVKIGSADYKPTPEDLEIWRHTFEAASADKNFKIFTHEGVTVERIGANSGILDINPDVQQLLKEIFMGLMVPEVIMTGGGDITYNNGGVSLDVLKQRYNQFRNMMAAFLKKKIFAPISKLNDFYEYENGEKKLIIPEVDWNQMSLFDTADYINMLMTLSGEQDRRISKNTLYRSLGLEWEEEQRKIKKEDIREAIRKKELMSLDRMQMNDLRALGEDDDIPEITEAALTEDSPYADGSGGALPGTSGGGAGPSSGGGLDLGLGGLGGGGLGAGPLTSTPPPPPPPPTGASAGGTSTPPPLPT
jgi:hypothetical protein